ncbi:MAG: hypothetical protein F6K28_30305 [Microcoleus sp. SIO2G3]|nr:hypothetical protein [Microcoleus sp. SIO2G3]
MSQDVITNKRVSEPLNAPASIQPWSADSEADKLMDDLFSDIDRILEGGSKLPTEPVKPEYVSLKSIVIPQITMPPALMPPQELVQQPNPDESIDMVPLEQLDTDVASPPVVQTKRWNWSIEKVLLAVGVASLVVMAIMLLTNKTKLTLPGWLNVGGSPSAENGQITDSDSQFISYMQRSLEVIDRKTGANQKPATPATTAPSTATTANLPPVPTAGNRTLAQNQAPTVLERVYIPVYPPSSPAAPSAPSVAARPSIPSVARPSVQLPPPPVRSSVPLPPPVTRPSAARPPATRPPSPTTPRAAAPSTRLPAPPAIAVPNSPSVQSPAPVANHTLVGLLELGDRSAALFDVSGVTQRITVGEAIGASGWILVSVANQEAVIRRNGEVRSVYVGQKF